jgi:organic radical activating enzyme
VFAAAEKPSSPDRAYLSEMFVSHQGEGPYAGQLQLFVRFAGCNVRCRYCDTPDSLERTSACRIDYPGGSSEALANPLTMSGLTRAIGRFVAEEPRIAMIAITGGEPMVQHRFLSRWLREQPPPIPCLLETNAIVAAGLPDVLRGVAVVSADIKLPSNSGEGARWEAHRRFLEACARSEGTYVYVKMPVDDSTEPEDVRRGARLVAELVPSALLFIQPVTDATTGAWRITAARLFSFARTAAAETAHVRVRPQLHKLIGIR